MELVGLFNLGQVSCPYDQYWPWLLLLCSHGWSFCSLCLTFDAAAVCRKERSSQKFVHLQFGPSFMFVQPLFAKIEGE